MNISDFAVPATWGSLKTLCLECNDLSQVPGNLSSLASLVSLNLRNQSWEGEGQPEPGFQILTPMHFLTLLQNLREVSLEQQQGARMPSSRSSVWSSTSQYALMQARLLIKNTPNCHVSLAD